MHAPAIIAPKKPTDAIRSASSVLPEPSAREIKLPLPCPKKNPNAWITVISENTTPTAPVMLVLSSRLTK